MSEVFGMIGYTIHRWDVRRQAKREESIVESWHTYLLARECGEGVLTPKLGSHWQLG